MINFVRKGEEGRLAKRSYYSAAYKSRIYITPSWPTI